MAGFDVRVRENVPMETRDGTVLRADVYSPASGAGYPVLLQRTPYDKASESNAATARDLSARGYVVAVQDIRGRYASEGDFIWQFQDSADTFDAAGRLRRRRVGRETAGLRRSGWHLGALLPVVVHMAARRGRPATLGRALRQRDGLPYSRPQPSACSRRADACSGRTTWRSTRGRRAGDDRGPSTRAEAGPAVARGGARQVDLAAAPRRHPRPCLLHARPDAEAVHERAEQRVLGLRQDSQPRRGANLPR